MEEPVLPLVKAPQRKPTVLVVEDHFMTRWSATEYFRHGGFRVIEATDATEALGLAETGASIDAVFTDVQLAGGASGYELAQWFAKHRPSTPVVITSGADDGGAVVASELRHFVRKPYDLDVVVQLLRKMTKSA